MKHDCQKTAKTYLINITPKAPYQLISTIKTLEENDGLILLIFPLDACLHTINLNKLRKKSSISADKFNIEIILKITKKRFFDHKYLQQIKKSPSSTTKE